MNRSTRDRILDGALEMFSMKGYKATTTKEIADKAGVNEVTLFRLFKTKENLFYAVIDREANLKDVLESIKLEPSEDLIKDLTDFGELMAMGMRERSALVRCLFMESITRPDLWEHVSHAPFEVLDQLESFFKKAKQKGAIKKGVDARLIAVMFFGFFFRHMIANAFLGSDPFYRMDRQTIRKFVTMFVKGMEG